MKPTEKIWMNGHYVNWNDANVHILTHTLHYGVGVFEGIRCYEQADGSSAIFRLQEHIVRLRESAHMFLMELPFDDKTLIQICCDLVKLNKLKSCYLRPLAYYSYGEMGLAAVNDVHVAIACWEWGKYLGEDGILKGIRSKISSFRRLSQESFLPKSKACGNYINSVLAKREAVLSGFQEALMLDSEGYLAEATGENIFIVKNGVIKTPPESSPILRGITRDTILTLLRDHGYALVEEKFSRDEAYICDEMFLCGTAAEITPVVEVDHRKLGAGTPGKVTQHLQKIFTDVVTGKMEKYEGWLHKTY